MSADECEFCFCDYCNPPDYIVKSGWVCPMALPIEEGDITHKCGGSNDKLISEEEWEESREFTMTEERGTSDKHDGNPVCPFMQAGYFQPCIKEDCMAWKDGECLLIQEKKS